MSGSLTCDNVPVPAIAELRVVAQRIARRNRLIGTTEGARRGHRARRFDHADRAGLVLLEGRIPDGVTVDRDAIDLSGSHASMTDVMAAVLGIQGSVSAKGHRLRAVGVTWSAGSEPKARELVTTLTEFGLTNIVTVRPSEATSTLTVQLAGR